MEVYGLNGGELALSTIQKDIDSNIINKNLPINNNNNSIITMLKNALKMFYAIQK